MYDWNHGEDAGRFVNTYADMILRLALTHGLTKQDAQDICQELFLRLLTKKKLFRDEEHEKAWVIRATGNACKNMLRSPHRKRQIPIEDARNVALPQKDMELFDLIQALPAKSRDAVSLYYLEGYSVEESAKLLGISPSAVRKRLERARSQLKTELKEVFS